MIFVEMLISDISNGTSSSTTFKKIQYLKSMYVEFNHPSGDYAIQILQNPAISLSNPFKQVRHAIGNNN
jgi:hypothetical protein